MHKGPYKAGILLFVLILYMAIVPCNANEETNINLIAKYCGDIAVIPTEFENGITEDATFTWYLIGLINNGEEALDDVRLSATLPRA